MSKLETSLAELGKAMALADVPAIRRIEKKIPSKAKWAAFDRQAQKGISRAREPADQEAATELVLFIDNDEPLYRQQHTPIRLNLLRKYRKGTYDAEKAVKLYGYLTLAAAKKYAKAHSSSEADYKTIFTPATREEAARNMARSDLAAMKNGDFDYLLERRK
jgi:hypothetical protein